MNREGHGSRVGPIDINGPLDYPNRSVGGRYVYHAFFSKRRSSNTPSLACVRRQSTVRAQTRPRMSCIPRVGQTVTLDELEARIIAIEANRVIIGLDGLDGVGKTTLGRELKTRLGADLISVDDYLDKNRGVYLGALRLEDLKSAIERSASRVVLVEGTCLREVAAQCGFAVDQYVYVRRLTRDGRWGDEEQCCPTGSAEVLKERELSNRDMFSRALGGEGVTDLGLHGELIDYHCRYRPFENADFVVDVREHSAREV